MWLWVLLEGINLFGGTETMWVKSNNMFGMTRKEYFNAHSEYYCPTVREIETRAPFAYIAI